MTIDTMEMDLEDFDRTLDEVLLEDGQFSKKSINGLYPLTLEKFRFKLVINPETEKTVLVHTFGDNNYYNANDKKIRIETGLKVFGHELIKKDSPDIYICDSIMDAMILNQELGLDAVAIFKDTSEIKNSYSLLDNKEIYFISSTDSFKNIKKELVLPNSTHLTFDTSVSEHFNRHKNIDLVNDYLLGCKSPDGIKTADINSMLKGDIVSKRSAGLSSGIKNLDRQTQGFSCDMVGIGAGTGCGKSTFMMQLAASMIKQNQKVGLMMFEQADEAETLLNLAGHFDRINYNYFFGTESAEVEFDYEFEELSTNESVEEVKSISPENKERMINDHLKPTVENIKDNVEIMTNDNDSPSVEDALRMVRSLVIQKGCKAIFLDHTTYLTDGVENQNQAAQILMQGLMQIKNRHRVNIFYVTHLRKSKSSSNTHEEGARVTLDDFAGGKASTQYATVNIGLERDMHNEDLDVAEITKMRVLKRRGMSVKPGDSITEMKFDIESNKLYPANCKTPICGWEEINF